MIFTCQICNKEFEASYKSIVCEDCKIGKCVVCGNEFKKNHPYTQKTCSPKCRGIYRKESGIAKQSAKKAQSTYKSNLESGKTKKKELTKVCKYCGKEFQTTSNRQIYCGNDYGKCPICGKTVKIKNMSLGPQACSEECRVALIKKTNLEKYGSECVFSNEQIKNKIKQTNLEKYGVEHYSSTDEFKHKYKQTCLDKFGTNTPLQNKEIKAKQIKTNNERYGGNAPTCDKEVKDKVRDTVNVKYGGFTLQSEELRDKVKSTMIEKYGVDNPLKSDKIREKIKNTNLARYGKEHYNQSKMGLQNSMLNPNKVDKYIEFKYNPKKYIIENYSSKPSAFDVCKDLGVTETPIYDAIINSNCRELCTIKQSSMELEVCEYIKSLSPNINIITNDRKILYPQEIDIYLPDYNIGIECNPTITHNSTICDPWNCEPKHYRYHKIKSLNARDQGIFLLHIFGYEWGNHKDVVLTRIRNLLGETRNKIYTRKCDVREVSSKDSIEFLNVNHLQGQLYASIRLGLYYEDKLVSLMTFNKMRKTMGTNICESDCNYELSRFCSLRDYSIVGGASKLFKYFIGNYYFNKIISFSDIAHTKGDLYKTLGFDKVNESEPSYVWVNLKDDSYYHRVKCQKHNLKRLFNDDSIDTDNMTEKEIMSSKGYVQVFDSGKIRWEYSLK